MYFKVFQDRAALELSGYFDTDFWGRTMLQICHKEEFARHAVIALGALSETMDVVRTVHMSGASPPPNEPYTPNGHAIGRWEGETLVVETTHLTAGEVNRNGIPKSKAMTLYETFDLQKRDDDTYLIVNLTITDPENFTEPHTSTEVFVLEPNWELFPFECHLTEY